MDMHFPRLQTSSLKELFVQQMEGMILSGKLPIGTKLPTERDLSEKMNVSRAVVNGGLAEMEAKGFLEVIPRKGTYVADYRYRGKLDILKSIMQYNGDSFDKEMASSVIQVRKDIACSAARLSAQNRTSENIEALTSIIEEHKKTSNLEELSELTFQLDYIICIISGNQIYPLISYSFKNIYLSIFKRYYSIDSGKKIIQNMELLVDAIRLRKPEAAAEAMLKMICDAQKIFMKNI
jgi:DNA-binding FadR family transcriptional regulator